MSTPTGKVWRPCGKCGGTGRIAGTTVAAGVCFTCQGAGRVQAPADWRQREARAVARRQRAAARRAATSAAPSLWAEFAAAHPAEAAVIEAGKDTDPQLGYAYSSVACFDPRDANPDQALYLVRLHLADRHRT